MPPKIYIRSASEDIDDNLVKLMNHYGVAHEVFDKEGDVEEDACLFCNCETLQNEQGLSSCKNSIISSFSNVFLYNLSPNTSKVMERFSDGRISVRNNEKPDTKYKVCIDQPEICGVLSNQSFCRNENKDDHRFIITNFLADNLIMVSDSPFFISFRVRGCRIFAIANSRIIDVDQHVNSSFKISDHFSEFVPILMFLKFLFKDRIWHSSHKYACFIVDDPLIRSPYGFLDYESLLTTMDEHNFYTDISFIPYNWRRTELKTARLLVDRNDRYSINVHGCDHSKGEFSIEDEEELNRRVSLATMRMDLHKERSGLSYDKVMVFPQGRFSTNALKVLKANNYLGAINTEMLPVNDTGLKISDLFMPAITLYHHFPLFIRRYPYDINKFALDMFMDKPILVVEHHSYLKDNYQSLNRFIGRINSLSEKIEWKNPASILENSYLRKMESNGTEVVKIFSCRATVQNEGNKGRKIIVLKDENEDIPIEKVLVNGEGADYTVQDDCLRLEIEIDAGGESKIEIRYKNPIGKGKDPSMIYKSKIAMRRLAKGMRDNWLEGNGHVSSSIRGACERIKKIRAYVFHICKS